MRPQPVPDTAPPDLPGYRFLQHIGAGGNARVYLYEQDLPRRKVAVKVLNESGLAEEARRRFTAEANVTAGLAHRHIVQVFDANVTADGRPYLVMPYYPQPNLAVRARRASFAVADVLRIGIQIGSAVETSHRNDVLHCDIKPQNILTDSYGEPALSDFGIATRKGGDGPGGLSVPWSPPEILTGDNPGDERSDVYSLGATLWHLLVGRSPFERQDGDNSTAAIASRIRTESAPRTERAEVPESLERLLRQSMAKDPARRPQTAMDLIRALQSIEQELRLPVTQPILPAVEQRTTEPGEDTITRPQPRPGTAPAPGGERRPADVIRGITVLPAPPGMPAADSIARAAAASPDTATVARSTRSADSAPAAVTETAAPVGAPGGVRAPDPDDAADERTVVRAGHAGPRLPRVRQLPPEPPSAAPVAAPRPPVWEGTGTPSVAVVSEVPRPRSGRVYLMAGIGLAAVAVVAGVLVLSRPDGRAVAGQGQGTPDQPGQGGQAGALGPEVSAPGTPVVSVTRVKPGEFRFTWTYANTEAGDRFDWHRVSSGSGPASGQVKSAAVTVHGTRVCITVQVVRGDGEASQPSQPVCGS